MGLSVPIAENHSLQPYNTFGIDVCARWFVTACDEAQLRAALAAPQFAGQPRLILGGGSNVLFTADFPGAVVRPAICGRQILCADNDVVLVEANAGEDWHEFVQWTLRQGLAGLENLSLIPGTVGAAPIQNIGAYGVELRESFHCLSAIDTDSGEPFTLDHAGCRFGYRDSIFKRELKNRAVIASVTFRLARAARLQLEYGDIRDELARMRIADPRPADVSAAVCAIRRRKLPDPKQIGNAGSFFKNPLVDHADFERLVAQHPTLPHYPAPNHRVKLAAAWLIEKAGWRGRRIGRAGVHERHALVLVNHGGASGAEVLQLARAIQGSVVV